MSEIFLSWKITENSLRDFLFNFYWSPQFALHLLAMVQVHSFDEYDLLELYLYG